MRNRSPIRQSQWVSSSYLVECYWPGVTTGAYAETIDKLNVASAPARDRDVQFIDSMLVPADEVAFYRFNGPSTTEVAHLCTRAGLPFQRILEYITAAPTRPSP